MSANDNIPVTVNILDKEYRIGCPAEQQNELLASANYLHKTMKEIRDSGKVVGADRIAVMAALNLTHEMLNQKNSQENFADKFFNRIRSLQERVDVALKDSQQMEF